MKNITGKELFFVQIFTCFVQILFFFCTKDKKNLPTFLPSFFALSTDKSPCLNKIFANFAPEKNL